MTTSARVRLKLTQAADLHPGWLPLAISFREREDEADGDAIGKNYENDAEQK
jgi:hypothetical protein